MISSIGLIVALGVAWRIWFADLERGDGVRIAASIIVSLVVAVLSLSFIVGGEL